MIPGSFPRVSLILIYTLCCVSLTCCARTDAPDETADNTNETTVRMVTTDGPVEVAVNAAPETITVGELVTVTLEAVYPEGVALTFPQPESPLGAFDVRSIDTPPDVPLPDGRRRRVQTITLDTFEPGLHEIPSLTLTWSDPRDEDPADSTTLAPSGELDTDPLPVTVRSVLAGDETAEDYRDIRDAKPVDAPGWRPSLGMILALSAAGLVLIIAITSLVLWLVRRTSAGPKPAPAVPPHVLALQQLDALRADNLIEQQAFQPYFYRLTDIIRHYIEARFDLRAPERTTEEFLRDARRSNALSAPQRDMLAAFLRSADMAKFALWTPESDEAHQALDEARAFIKRTAPAETGPRKGGAG